MKKALLILMVGAMMLSGVGCSKKDSGTTSTEQTDLRKVSLDLLGLEYTTPEEWVAYQEKNIYPITHTINDAFALINYCYITDKTFEAMNDLSIEIDKEKEYLSICEIAVVPEENIESENVTLYFAKFANNELVGQQQGYNYYILYDAINDTSLLSDEEKATYEELKTASKSIAETIRLYEFDPNELKNSNKSKYITFNTQTLEGEKMTSQMFADHEVTLVNFWSVTDCYPERDNSKELQDLYNKIKAEGKNYGVVQILVDLPSPDGSKETLAELAKLNVNGQYTSLVMDETLASFVMNNLEGLPTSFIVNSSGEILGSPIQGILEGDLYYSLLYNEAS